MKQRALFGIALVAALALARSRPALADEGTAERRFMEGAAAFARRDFATAARAFEAAHRAAPSGAALYNAGLAWDATGEHGRAADAFTEAQRVGGLDAAQTRDIKKRLDGLTKKLGLIEVEAPPNAEVSIDNGQFEKAPLRKHAAPGDHEIMVTFAGGLTSTQRVVVTAGATAAARFEPPAPVAPPPPPPPPPAWMSPLRIAGFATIGGAVASTAVAAGLGAAALGAKGTFDDSHYTDKAARDRAVSMRTGANVAWVVTGVLAAGGVALVVFAPSSSPSTATALRVGPGSLSITGRF